MGVPPRADRKAPAGKGVTTLLRIGRAPFGRFRERSADPVSGWDRWTFANKHARQPLQLRIQSLLSAGPYDAPGNIDLANFADPGEFPERAAQGGVKASLEPSAEQVKVGAASGRYAATNPSSSRQAAWSKIGRTFTPPINLTGREALGLWVHGDGKGEVLNLQLLSPSHLSHGIGDHYIIVDFHGWRYFELIEPEGERHADYVWPYGGHYAIYRESVRPASIERLNLFYNNLPPKETAVCYLSPIRALPTVSSDAPQPGGQRGRQADRVSRGNRERQLSGIPLALGLQTLRAEGRDPGRRPAAGRSPPAGVRREPGHTAMRSVGRSHAASSTSG